MGIVKLQYHVARLSKNTWNDALSNPEFKKFNSSLLDLGDISADGESIEALAAVFDLEGFTAFCNQIDPHLVIPEFLQAFLDWLFKSLSSEFVQIRKSRSVVLWCRPPSMRNFWEMVFYYCGIPTTSILQLTGNVVDILRCICQDYAQNFLPQIRKSVVGAPSRLRCGIARGRVISIGEGRDFVGPCINVAARVQKLGQFSFCFPKRGFNLAKHFTEDSVADFVLIQSAVRGLGECELLYVLKKEFEALPQGEKKKLSL